MNIYRLINRFAAWGLQVSTSKCELITPRRLFKASKERTKVKNPFFLPTAGRGRPPLTRAENLYPVRQNPQAGAANE